MSRISGFFFLLITMSFAGCLRSDDCDYNECSFVVPQAETEAVENYLASQSITNAQKHCSGMYYVVEEPGSGDTPNGCSRVTVDYVGRLTNGTMFDQGVDYENFLTNLISGWRNGLPRISEGGRIKLYIPPSLGYGPQTNGPIPGNSILVFTITLKRSVD